MFLTPFSRSQEVLECWKMACLHSVSEGVDGFLSNMQHTRDIFLEPDREIWDFSEGDWGLR